MTISPSSDAALGELRHERIEQLGEVAVERLLVAALDEDLVAVAEDERAEAVPLGLEDPAVAFGEFADALGEHREDGRVDGEVHGVMVIRAPSSVVGRRSSAQHPLTSGPRVRDDAF